MFCIRCGNELPDDSRFCSKCGVSTDNYSAKTSEPQKVEQKYKKEYSWQVILEIIFTLVIPFIGSFIIYKVSSVFGNIIPSNSGAVGSVTVIGIILLFVISWILWALGKYIGKRLSNETGLVLGIILIIFGITLYIGIPIIIYSREAKEVRIVR
ncbi:MAG: zinc-ribbon domain-containing protein [Treponema sp.]|jgi:putative Mn2+ efflux pump MntP|nr:zinc-ribbon domain-containing protein [Treponema sp.]